MLDNAKLFLIATRTAEVLAALESGKISWPVEVEEHLLPEVHEALERFSVRNYRNQLQQPEDTALQTAVLQGFFHYVSERYTERLQNLEQQWQEGAWVEIQASLNAKRERLGVLAGEIASKQTRVEILSYQNTKDQYQVDDSGVGQIVAINQYYEETVDKIYGNHGRGFINYLKDRTERSYKIFAQSYEDIGQDGELGDGEQMDPHELSEACIRVENLVRIWNDANYWSQYAYNFLMTNRSIFHDLDDNHSLFFSLGNIVRQTRPVLRQHAYSAVYANALIMTHHQQKRGSLIVGGGDVFRIGDLQEDFWEMFRSDSVGSWMLRIYLQGESSRHLEGFRNRYCQEMELPAP